MNFLMKFFTEGSKIQFLIEYDFLPKLVYVSVEPKYWVKFLIWL
jgi:hypothetical protein